MSKKIRVPLLPESVSDATIAIWIKKVGEEVKEEEVLLELETDKVILEVIAPASGILTEIIKEQDALVHSGEIIGIIETEQQIQQKTVNKIAEKKTMPENNNDKEGMAVENQGSEYQPQENEQNLQQENQIIENTQQEYNHSTDTMPEEQSVEPMQEVTHDNSETEIRQEILQELEQIQSEVPEEAPQDLPVIEEQQHQETTEDITKNHGIATDNEVSEASYAMPADDSPFASPSVRKAMAEYHLQAEDINGSGKHGKILKEDVEQHLQQPTTEDHRQEDNRIEENIVETINGEEQPMAKSLAIPIIDTPAEEETLAKEENCLKSVADEQVITDTASPIEEGITEEGNNKQINQQQADSDLPVDAQTNKIKSVSNSSERRVPMTRLRARIAERLVEAQQNAAILTTFNDVDLSEIIRLRKIYRSRFEQVHSIKLGFMSFFVKAATEALKRYPEVNARIDGQDIIYQGNYDIGVAVSTERGLVVPIVRDTNTLGHADIEKKIQDYAHRARNNQLELDELTGGTFSITNGGVFGSMLSTPIINPPQSAILGMHKIEDRPVAINGEVVIRPMMYLALSYDHRLIDGKTAVSFLVKIKELLEDPASLFLEL
jgi:2-oxoglutarate dehydrogenase E2 component (dihydrolipoamide succinyltransferase)